MKYLLTFVAIAGLVSGCVTLDMGNPHNDQPYDLAVTSILPDFQKLAYCYVTQAASLPSFYDPIGGTPHSSLHYAFIDQDDEGTQYIWNYAKQTPAGWYGYDSWHSQTMTTFYREAGKWDFGRFNLITIPPDIEYMTDRMCTLLNSPSVDPPGGSNSDDWVYWDWE